MKGALDAEVWRSIVEHACLKNRTLTESNPAPGCWLWLGAVDSSGYPKSCHRGIRYALHRAMWSAYHGGKQPGGDAVVRHLCHNKRCLAPWHLAIGTHEDNARDNATNPKALAAREHHRAESRAAWARAKSKPTV